MLSSKIKGDRSFKENTDNILASNMLEEASIIMLELTRASMGMNVRTSRKSCAMDQFSTSGGDLIQNHIVELCKKCTRLDIILSCPRHDRKYGHPQILIRLSIGKSERFRSNWIFRQ